MLSPTSAEAWPLVRSSGTSKVHENRCHSDVIPVNEWPPYLSLADAMVLPMRSGDMTARYIAQLFSAVYELSTSASLTSALRVTCDPSMSLYRTLPILNLDMALDEVGVSLMMPSEGTLALALLTTSSTVKPPLLRMRFLPPTSIWSA